MIVPMIRIFIADDHTIVRDGLKRILSEEPEMVVVGEAENGREALRQLKGGAWDVLLLDVSMPELGGLETLKRVLRMHPEKRVLILTQHEESLLALRFLKAGVAGYLTKMTASDELVLAIQEVNRGGRYITPGVANELIGQMYQEEEVHPHSVLSDREYSVLCRIAGGKPLSTIADEMGVSISTVSTYRRRILDKMGFTSNADLTRYVLEKGLSE